MLLRKLHLVNYAGIFNGMGLNEISIDFTKCKSRIILIRGDNGSGKSTIEKTLKPLPDDNNEFIPERNAMKEIEYYDEFTDTIYCLRFIHECKQNGTRATAKGYFTKIVNGFPTELNPSGNITSCKDLIFEELKLDPNYIALSQLSSVKRGLADMRPFERKRYVNAILSSTEAYNNIYKKLSKKSLTYKGLMNSIVSKLDSIGEPGKLSIDLELLNNKIDTLSIQHKNAIELKSEAEGAMKEIDPDGKFMEEFNSYNSQLRTLDHEITSLRHTLKTEYGIEEEWDIHFLEKMKSDNVKELNDYITRKQICEQEINRLFSSRDTEASEIQAKSAKLASLVQGTSYNQLKEIKFKCETRMNIIRNRMNFLDLDNITRDEFVLGLETLLNIQDSIRNYMGSCDHSVLTDVIDTNSNRNYQSRITILKNKIESIDEQITELTIDIKSRLGAKDLALQVSNRPKDCFIDNCPYISKILEASKLYDENIIRDKQFIIDKISDTKFEYLDEIKYLEKCNEASIFLNNICRQIDSSKSILSKLPIKELLVDKVTLISNILDGKAVDAITVLYKYIDEANDIEEYEALKKELNNTNAQLNSLKSQAEFIESLESDIKRLQAQLDKDIEEIESKQEGISVCLQNELSSRERIETLDKAIGILLDINSKENQKRIIYEKLEVHKTKIDKLTAYREKIMKCMQVINSIESELEPMRRQKESLEYQLNLTSQYQMELNQYKSMYDKIEVLKYHSSTATGIQLLFSEMYLEKTRVISNNILQNLFGGKFALMQFNISESDFAMPVAVDNGINHEDISNMSSAEITLLSMILSISLLSQTSTKLNIIIGDEIDAPFDADNRREFFNILYQLMQIVQASQCVLISHNSELNQDDCDVILLRNNNADGPNCSGNVIWSYYNN